MRDGLAGKKNLRKTNFCKNYNDYLKKVIEVNNSSIRFIFSYNALKMTSFRFFCVFAILKFSAEQKLHSFYLGLCKQHINCA